MFNFKYVLDLYFKKKFLKLSERWYYGILKVFLKSILIKVWMNIVENEMCF